MSDRKPIPLWPEYEIDKDGNVFRVSPACGATVGAQLKWAVLKSGYAKVSLCRNSKRIEFLVHRLVALTFIGDIPKGMDVCHYDGNKLNNSVSNLRIDTRRENVKDNLRLGRHNRGERCGTHKYKAAQIADIKCKMQNGVSVRELNKQTGMPLSTLYAIRSGTNWGWMNGN